MSSQLPYPIQILKDELTKRTRANSRYSLRSFARDLKVAPSWLSSFLNGKKGISLKRAEKLAKTLQLNSIETKLFLINVQAQHARGPLERNAAVAKLTKLSRTSKKVKRVSDIEQSVIQNWYYLPIMELFEIEGFETTPFNIAKRLKIPMIIAESAITNLKSIGWLHSENGHLQVSHSLSESSMDVPSDAIKNYHKEVMLKAQEALYCQSVLHREFVNMTFAFDTKKMDEVKKYLRSVQTDIAEKFYDSSENKNSVYQLSIQFFRMDPGEKSK